MPVAKKILNLAAIIVLFTILVLGLPSFQHIFATVQVILLRYYKWLTIPAIVMLILGYRWFKTASQELIANWEWDPELLEACQALSSGQVLPDEQMQQIVATINRILHDKDAELDFDLALRCHDSLGPQHSNALPYLCQMIQECSKYERDYDYYALSWALIAIGKVGIGGDISVAAPHLLQVVKDNADFRMRSLAAMVLRQRGFDNLIKRCWYNWFDWKVRKEFLGLIPEDS